MKKTRWVHKKEFAAFHERHGGKFFTPTWNNTVESEGRDTRIEKHWRVLGGIRRYAWGNLSDFAVDCLPQKKETDPKPKPLSQAKLADLLKLSVSSVSDSCIFWKERGYLRADHPFLYPEDEVNTLESTKHTPEKSDSNDDVSPYLRCKSLYCEEFPGDAKILSDFEAMRNQVAGINKRVLAYYRDWQRQEKVDNPNVSDASETSGNPMRSCAPAQYQTYSTNNNNSPDIRLENPDSKASVSDTPKPKSELPPITKPVTTNLFNGHPERPLKLPIGSKGKSIGEETTTTDVNSKASSSSPSPIQSLPIPREFADRLPRSFAEAGKPTPTRAQIAAAYIQVVPRWEEFLGWIPNADEFRRLAHPGGLRTLIEFFLATEPGQQSQKRPVDRQDAKREELLLGLHAIDRLKGRRKSG